MRYKFTTRELEKALDSMYIIVDTREKDKALEGYKANWDRQNIKYYSMEEYRKLNGVKKIPKKDLHEATLPAGDYSAMIPKGALLDRAVWFDKVTVIEKKKNIDELAGNIKVTNGEYKRMCNEFARLKANKTKHRILIADHLYFKHTMLKTSDQHHNWKNQESLETAIHDAESEWGTYIIPVAEEYMAREIYKYLRSDIKAYLKNNFKIIDDLTMEVEI